MMWEPDYCEVCRRGENVFLWVPTGSDKLAKQGASIARETAS